MDGQFFATKQPLHMLWLHDTLAAVTPVTPVHPTCCAHVRLSTVALLVVKAADSSKHWLQINALYHERRPHNFSEGHKIFCGLWFCCSDSCDRSWCHAKNHRSTPTAQSVIYVYNCIYLPANTHQYRLYHVCTLLSSLIIFQ